MRYDFNRSMQHLHASYSKEEAADKAKIEYLPHRIEFTGHPYKSERNDQYWWICRRELLALVGSFRCLPRCVSTVFLHVAVDKNHNLRRAFQWFVVRFHKLHRTRYSILWFDDLCFALDSKCLQQEVHPEADLKLTCRVKNVHYVTLQPPLFRAPTTTIYAVPSAVFVHISAHWTHNYCCRQPDFIVRAIAV